MASHLQNRPRIGHCASKRAHSRFRGSLKRQTLCFALVTSLLVLPMPPLGLSAMAGQVLTKVRSVLQWASTLPLMAETALVPKPQPMTVADRIAAVARIEISPSKFVVYKDVSVVFTATGYDGLGGSGHIVQGVPFTWSVSDTSPATIDPTSGRITALRPGLVWARCEAGSVHAKAPVFIKPGEKSRQTDAEWRADQEALQEDGRFGTSTPTVAGLLDQLTPTAYAQGGGGDIGFDELW